jgi:uncharacterized protein (TIGR01244 family)
MPRIHSQFSHRLPLLIALMIMLMAPLGAQTEKTEAPFGDTVSERIPLYHRAAPTVATAGPLGRLGLIETKAVGFRSVLSLGPTAAQDSEDKSLANFVLLRYFNVPVAEGLPAPEQIAEIRQILADPVNVPILIYGREPDQAAAAWALIRAAAGLPPEFAFQEGLTAGLRGNAAAVRARLGVPE